MALTAIQVKKVTLEEGKRRAKLSDGGGLYLMLTRLRSGEISKAWRFKYQFNKKERLLSLGMFPELSLATARAERAEARYMLRQGIDPCQQKAARKKAAQQQDEANKQAQLVQAMTFQVVAEKWLDVRRDKVAASTLKKDYARLPKYAFPLIGGKPITEVSKRDLVGVIEAVTKTGKTETAKRLGNMLVGVLNYAADSGLIESVPHLNLLNILPPIKANKMPAVLDAARLAELLQYTDRYGEDFPHAQLTTCTALKLLPYLFVRAGEFRKAKWKDIDLEAALWTIPAADRKLLRHKKEDPENVHLVPLSKQAVALLQGLKPYTGGGVHVLPSIRGDSRPMSENTINNALGRMGFKGEMVGHGWRSVFKTKMKEMGHSEELTERQLAHIVGNQVSRAYDRGDYMKQRQQMMQAWADYLDALKHGADVIPIRSNANG